MSTDPNNRILRWLAARDTGLSSECIAFTYLGVPCDPAYPRDPADLGRCLRLIRLVPELREGFADRMAKVCHHWAGFAARWAELETSMMDEVGIDWEKGQSAPRTYDLMQTIINDQWRTHPDYDVTFSPSGVWHYATRRQPPEDTSGAARVDERPD